MWRSHHVNLLPDYDNFYLYTNRILNESGAEIRCAVAVRQCDSKSEESTPCYRFEGMVSRNRESIG